MQLHWQACGVASASLSISEESFFCPLSLVHEETKTPAAESQFLGFSA